MIKSHYSFIDGVSDNFEQKLQLVCPTWDDFLEKGHLHVPLNKHSIIKSKIVEANERLNAMDHEYFAKNILSKHHYRLFDYFGDSVGYLDIETTGLSKERNKITTISIFDGNNTVTFIHGKDMDEEKLFEEINKYKVIVTFNGTGFDLPFIEAKFPNIKFNCLHIDLRYLCKKVGLSGGLKRIEHEMGISRGDEVEGIDGSFAVRLWKKYERRGDEAALDLLVKYNQEDVINLEVLLKKVLEMVKKGISY